MPNKDKHRKYSKNKYKQSIHTHIGIHKKEIRSAILIINIPIK